VSGNLACALQRKIFQNNIRTSLHGLVVREKGEFRRLKEREYHQFLKWSGDRLDREAHHFWGGKKKRKTNFFLSQKKQSLRG